MPAFSLAVMIGLVAILGTLGGAATRYERYGPAAQRGPAGALAVVSLSLAVTVALTAFGVATFQTDGAAWRLLGVACAGGIFGGMVAARGVDHYLVCASRRQALAALGADVQAGVHAVKTLLEPLPWQSVADAVAGVRIETHSLERREAAQR